MRESLFETLIGLAVVAVAGFFLVVLAVRNGAMRRRATAMS